jgi:hypothetical protein
MYCGVLTSGVRMMDRVVEWVALSGAVGRGTPVASLPPPSPPRWE